jgi:integrase
MDFTNLRKNYNKLLLYLKSDRYTESFIRAVRFDIQWILRNESDKQWQSYVDIYNDRVLHSQSKGYKKNKRISFGTIERFDLFGEYPNRRPKNSFIKRGAYHQLIPVFKELVDFYKQTESSRGLKERTVAGSVSHASVFLHFMQAKGRNCLRDIDEDDVLSFFLDENGELSKSSSYKKSIAAVFKVGTVQNDECRKVLAYLPSIRPKRKNAQFLTPEEIKEIRAALDDEASGLSLRDRAIGKLLYFTGMRACDIVEIKFVSIDWETEQIRLPQQKTGVPLELPLTVPIGNPIHDYIAVERPKSDDSHLFLSELYPFYPLTASALYSISEKIYKAASVRREASDRRGTHLFRYNVATSLLGNGIPRPVISQALGHDNPLSLEPYIHADFVHLKECALSIEAFPVSEEVFSL